MHPEYTPNYPTPEEIERMGGAEVVPTLPSKQLADIRKKIKINGDGTATLPTEDLSWLMNELELWSFRRPTN